MTILDIDPKQFAYGSAERLLWRICASHRCPGLINGEAVLCEAFHDEALAILSRAAHGPKKDQQEDDPDFTDPEDFV